MDVLLRFRGIGLLLTLLICSPVLAQEPENEDSRSAPGKDPHSGIDSAIENADDPADAIATPRRTADVCRCL
jgi:hypothetical protein